MSSFRIYLAGYHSGRGTSETTSDNFKISHTTEYPWLLESYHYYTDAIEREIKLKNRSIFLDSGAFSAFTQGSRIDGRAYARFVKERLGTLVHQAANLDYISNEGGDAGAEKTYLMQKWLERHDATVIPVHHARDDDKWLKKYLDEGYDHLCLGGMVPESTPYLKQWLDHVWHHYLTNPDGTARVKVHGFGLTTLALMYRYPWYSVDSTSWVMASRFGGIMIDLPQPDGGWADVKVDFSTQSGKLEDLNSWHYVNLEPFNKACVLERLEQLETERLKAPAVEADLEYRYKIKQGYNPEALGAFYGWRDHFNINYFRRGMERGVKVFKLEQPKLF